MSQEKFNPSDPRYKEVKDLPYGVEKRFKDVRGGFVRSSVRDEEPQARDVAEAELLDPVLVRKMNELLNENDQRIFEAYRLRDAVSAQWHQLRLEIKKIEKSVEAPLREWSNQQLQRLGHSGYLERDKDNNIRGVVDGLGIFLFRFTKLSVDGVNLNGEQVTPEIAGKKFFAKFGHCAYSTEDYLKAAEGALPRGLMEAYEEIVRHDFKVGEDVRLLEKTIPEEEMRTLKAMTPSELDIRIREKIGNLLD